MQALQDEHLEHEHTAGGLASGCAFALGGVDAGENGAEYLPVDDGVEPLQRVACFREAGVAVLKVKQAVLHGVDLVGCLCLFYGTVNFRRLRKLGWIYRSALLFLSSITWRLLTTF